MSFKQRLLKMFSAIFVLILATLPIVACGSTGLANQVNYGQITICHATSDAANPYNEITIDFNELTAHVDHKDDVIPAPVDGCPKVVQTDGNDGEITICHATSSLTNPYDEITIDFNELRGHSNHNGDIVPSPQGGCPSVTPTPGITETSSVAETPTMTTKAATAAENNDGKITICHATGSSKNPYVMITVSVNGLNGHGNHSRDIIPAPAGGCPK
jgi:hypothetical protein